MEKLPIRNPSPSQSISSQQSERSMDCNSEEDELKTAEQELLDMKEKRGRGRSQTTGLYVGRAKAKRECMEVEREELDFRLEKLAAEKLEGAISILGVRGEGIKSTPMAGLRSSINEAVGSVREIVKISRGLKGTSKKILKEAAEQIEIATEEMGIRIYEKQPGIPGYKQEDWEKKLKAAEEKIEELTKKIEFLRSRPEPSTDEGQKVKRRKPDYGRDSEDYNPGKERNTDNKERDEKLTRSIVDKINDLLERKLNSMREELDRKYLPRGQEDTNLEYLPIGNPTMGEEKDYLYPGISAGTGNETNPEKEKERLRPGKKEKNLKPRVISDIRIRGPKMGTSREKEEGNKFARIGKKLQPEIAEIGKRLEQKGTENMTRDAEKELWTSVIGRKKRTGQKISEEENTKAGTKGQKAKAIKPEPRKKTRRLPKTEAITIVCPDGSYESVMEEATSRINLADLGITEGVRQRTTKTGALSIQIEGEGREEKADKLSQCLKTTLANREGVKISRPSIKSEVLITGLDHSTRIEKIVSAMVEAGECREEEVKVNPIKVNPKTKRGTAWARCPAKAANKIIAAGGLKVGWARVGVILLERRQLQCYRCLAPGHVSNECTSTTDRSKKCYRCGSENHVARDCKEALNCPVCVDRGVSSDHRAGSKRCIQAGNNAKRDRSTKRKERLEIGPKQKVEDKGRKKPQLIKKTEVPKEVPKESESNNRYNILDKDEESMDWVAQGGEGWASQEDTNTAPSGQQREEPSDSQDTQIPCDTQVTGIDSDREEHMEIDSSKKARPAPPISPDEGSPITKRIRTGKRPKLIQSDDDEEERTATEEANSQHPNGDEDTAGQPQQ